MEYNQEMKRLMYFREKYLSSERRDNKVFEGLKLLIYEIDKKLKAFESSIGRTCRNVGNYAIDLSK